MADSSFNHPSNLVDNNNTQNSFLDMTSQGVSFTMLLSQDPQLGQTYGGQSVSSSMSQDDSPPLPLNNPTNVKKSSRGANFSIDEDTLLVSAWLNTSIDAIQGTDQKHTQLWEKISDYFKEFKKSTIERSTKSLIHWWSLIQKLTNKFCSYLTQIESVNQSGLTDHDKYEKAKLMYQKIEKGNFQFEHCWHILKDEPKWASRSTKDVSKQRKTMFPSPTSISTLTPTTTTSPKQDAIENEVIELDLPIGRKAEKEKRKAMGRQTEEINQIRKMKYTFLEESRVQEKEFYRLKVEKMEHDKVKEEKEYHLKVEMMEYNKAKEEKNLISRQRRWSMKRQKKKKNQLKAEKLRIDAEKIDIARKELDERIMMMDMSVMPELQRLYIEKRQREIMIRDSHA